jgi:HAE1 family hydrophobic/amphiphilic exporter-1
MFLAKLSIKRPIMVTMGIFVILIFGYLGYTTMNVNNMPEVDIPYVTISTIYPGAGPQEIETQISKKVEDAVATVSQIKMLQSYSLDGASIVMIEFDMEKDIDVANQEVKDKVDAILNELPDDAELPIIQKVDLQAMPIIDIVFSGELSPIELYDYADNRLKDQFAQIAGVGQVSIVGGQEREIKVNFENTTVYENMISLPQMLQILAAQNFDIPGGYFQLEDQEFTVRMEGKYHDIDEIKNLELNTPFGTKKLRQLAEVEDGGKKIRQRAIFFDNDAKSRDENVVRMSLIKSADGNAVNIAEEVYVRLDEIRQTLPENTSLKVINDDSKYTKSAKDDTISNIILGIIFTSIILLFFLGDIRSTIIVALSMPTSIISTFLLMNAFGMSINMISLMGISVTVGVLVANSVVVLENIFRHKQMGKSKKDSAFEGTREVTTAVIASTLTNIVVFLPLANISSIAGQFLKDLALAATFSTIFSLIISFTLTPMLASLILPKKISEGWFTRTFKKFENMWANLYEKSLLWMLKAKWNWKAFLIVFASLFLFVFTLMTLASKIGFEFMPVQDNGKISIQVELPEGYNLKETEQVTKEIEKRISLYDEVIHTITNVGKTSDLDIGTNLALMEVHLTDVNDRDNHITEYVDEFIKDLSDIPNATLKIAVLEGEGGPGAPIDFFLLGQDMDVLVGIQDEIMEKAKNIKGLVNFDNSTSTGKPEINVVPKRDKIAELGLSVQEIALTLRASIEGIVSSQYQEAGNEYDILVTLNDNSTNTPEKVANIPIVTQAGVFRLSQLADIDFTEGFTKIIRRDKYKAIQFTGNVSTGVPTGDVMDELNKISSEIDLPPGYAIEWSGSSEMQQELVADLGFAFMLAIILTYMLLAAILESFWQPFLILLTLPLALIGVFVIMYITGTTFSLTAMMGVIMLLGIVVNNAILLLDYTNQLIREKHMGVAEALITAGPVRLKPIIMSTVAIILGMLPLALGIGDAGAEMRQPLGVVSIGGLVASAFLTLFTVPAAFYLVSSFFGGIKRIFKKA